MTEPLLTSAKARAFLGQLKGCKRIDHYAFNNLVKKEGLPKHTDPFGSGRWCFLASELTAWFEARLGVPVASVGRPPRAGYNKSAVKK